MGWLPPEHTQEKSGQNRTGQDGTGQETHHHTKAVVFFFLPTYNEYSPKPLEYFLFVSKNAQKKNMHC